MTMTLGSGALGSGPFGPTPPVTSATGRRGGGRGIGALLVVLAALPACSGGHRSALPPPTSTATSAPIATQAPTTTAIAPTAAPTAAPTTRRSPAEPATTHAPALATGAAALAPFGGDWFFHGFALHIAGQAGTATFRTYRFCGPGVAPPCDSRDGDAIVDGGRATLGLDGVDASGAAHGTVVSSTDPSTLPVGPATLTRVPQDQLSLHTSGGNDLTLCGPDAPAGTCGA